MAGTSQGEKLTVDYRAAQLAIRAGSINQLVELWRVVDPTRLSDTIDVFARAAAILAGSGYTESAVSAARYYPLFRRAEGVGAAFSVSIPGRPTVDSLAGEIRGAALLGIIDARRRGETPEGAKRNGFVRAAGALAKLILNGGRRTIIDAVQDDRRALGWSRVVGGDDPCAFCRMLAARGPAYKSRKSADFQPHDTCSCTAEPSFVAGPTAQAEEFARQWTEAQAWARENGISSAGTANPALNIFRQYLARQAADTPSEVSG